jgi:hypothetical protein
MFYFERGGGGEKKNNMEKTVSECPKVTHPIRRKENGKNIKEDHKENNSNS